MFIYFLQITKSNEWKTGEVGHESGILKQV